MTAHKGFQQWEGIVTDISIPDDVFYARLYDLSSSLIEDAAYFLPSSGGGKNLHTRKRFKGMFQYRSYDKCYRRRENVQKMAI